MHIKFFTLLLTCWLSLSGIACADSKSDSATANAQEAKASTSVTSKQERSIAKYVEETLGLKVSKVKQSAITDFYEVSTNQGVLYLRSDRQYMFYGNLYSLKSGVTNLTQQSQAVQRKSQLVQFEKDMIIFPAKNEKHVVTVFTDVSCGYCKKLHQEIKDYNDLGITVRYLAFPRGGPKSKSFDQMQQVWCSSDQRGSLTRVKQGVPVQSEALSRRCDKTIQQQYDLGVAFGVNGTPAIVLDDGRMLPGYYPAKDLLKTFSKR